MDSISEKLAFFAFDNTSRTLNETLNLRFGYGLAGALLLDLMRLGALAVDEEGQFFINPSVTVKKNYLNRALAVLKELTAPSVLDMLEQLIHIITPVKALLLENLQKDGFLKAGTSRLKWSFALKSYSLKAGKKGYRRRLAKDLLADKVQLLDFHVLQLARAANFLSGGAINKKLALTVNTRIDRLAALMKAGPAAMIAENLPAAMVLFSEAVDTSASSALSLKSAVWEWRGFWASNKNTTLIQAGQAFKQLPANFAFEETTDIYLLLEGITDNIKCRGNALEIKRPVESLQGYTAFLPKETYLFPLSAAQLKDLFVRVPAGFEQGARDLLELRKMLEKAGYGPKQMEVKKKRFVVKLKNRVQIEFCSLNLDGKKYISACVESPSYDATHAHAVNFRAHDVKVMGYVEFLKSKLLEPVS
jgi:hypothetical protein